MRTYSRAALPGHQQPVRRIACYMYAIICSSPLPGLCCRRAWWALGTKQKKKTDIIAASEVHKLARTRCPGGKCKWERQICDNFGGVPRTRFIPRPEHMGRLAGRKSRLATKTRILVATRIPPNNKNNNNDGSTRT